MATALAFHHFNQWIVNHGRQRGDLFGDLIAGFHVLRLVNKFDELLGECLIFAPGRNDIPFHTEEGAHIFAVRQCWQW